MPGGTWGWRHMGLAKDFNAIRDSVGSTQACNNQKLAVAGDEAAALYPAKELLSYIDSSTNPGLCYQSANTAASAVIC